MTIKEKLKQNKFLRNFKQDNKYLSILADFRTAFDNVYKGERDKVTVFESLGISRIDIKDKRKVMKFSIYLEKPGMLLGKDKSLLKNIQSVLRSKYNKLIYIDVYEFNMWSIYWNRKNWK